MRIWVGTCLLLCRVVKILSLGHGNDCRDLNENRLGDSLWSAVERSRCFAWVDIKHNLLALFVLVVEGTENVTWIVDQLTVTTQTLYNIYDILDTSLVSTEMLNHIIWAVSYDSECSLLFVAVGDSALLRHPGYFDFLSLYSYNNHNVTTLNTNQALSKTKTTRTNLLVSVDNDSSFISRMRSYFTRFF